MSTISVSLPTDVDGFVSQECPACLRRFRVQVSDESGDKIHHCPYCAHSGEDCWWTPEQTAFFTSQVEQQLVAPMLDRFADEVNNVGNTGFVRLSASVDHRAPVIEPLELDLEMTMITFPCCGEPIKYDGAFPELFCIICGRSHRVAPT